MRKTLLFFSAILWIAHIASAQFRFGVPEELPTQDAIASITISPEDVVQDSVQRLRMSTNVFVVQWQYTEEGGRKMRAFWDAHTGKSIRTRVGDFEASGLRAPRSPARTNNIIPWEKSRTDKFFGVNEKDADAIVAGLKK